PRPRFDRRSVARRLLRLLMALLLVPIAALTPAAADAASPLSISMTTSANPVASGASLTYTITVVNTGGARVDEVALTDQLNGLTALIRTSSVGSGGKSASLVICPAGTRAGGQPWIVTIRGTVGAPSAPPPNTTATVAGAKSSTTFTNSTTVATLVSN